MKFNKETILILAGGMALMIGWYALMNHLGWMSRPAPVMEEGAPSADAEPPVAEFPQEPPLADSTAPVPSQPMTDTPKISGADNAPPPPPVVKPETVTSITGKDGEAKDVTFFIDPVNGGITAVRLHAFEPYGEKGSGEPVELGSWRFPFCSTRIPGFTPAGAAQVDEHDDGEGVTLERRGADGVKLVETWRLDRDDPYRFTYSLAISSTGGEAVAVAPLIRLGGLTGDGVAAGPKMSRVGDIDLAVDVAPDLRGRPASFTVKKVRKSRPDGGPVSISAPAAWTAVHNKYFAYMLIPHVPTEAQEPSVAAFADVAIGVDQMAEDNSIEGPPRDWIHATAALGTIRLPADGAEMTFVFSGYAGPKTLKALSSLAPNTEDIMRLDYFMFFRAGWMKLIAKTILRSLIALNGFFGGTWGFGFAIIVVTVVIKTLFWPLTHKSTVSMRRMAQLQPEIKAMREKYKNDPQMLNRKTMEFYKENKVNPAGGCLPMLLQIPVFFALFNTLRGAVELRHAAFFYISDLSQPDTLLPFGESLPVRPLAILMSATMLLQQRLTPTAGDPSQKKMMMFMSLFFMIIFYSMPSGLTLYWTTNQVLTIGQNLVTKRIEARKEARGEQPLKA
ncbi:MAG: YidC/Oxa1 family insertase periplasmic-domain containing protein [Lentisphaeria bacterium]|nr:YidC/Oxa1 family insertase periplasmic-domain containing protein [Lentisphaeria bacterium]